MGIRFECGTIRTTDNSALAVLTLMFWYLLKLCIRQESGKNLMVAVRGEQSAGRLHADLSVQAGAGRNRLAAPEVGFFLIANYQDK